MQSIRGQLSRAISNTIHESRHQRDVSLNLLANGSKDLLSLELTVNRISLGASVFDSLDSSDSSNVTQKYIRQGFLQMIVLLMSLLNDSDLQEIKGFIEDTYNLCIDRWYLEMLFLKVLPLASINPKVFLDALVHTIEGYHLDPSKPAARRYYSPVTMGILEGIQVYNAEHWWKRFLVDRLQQGFLIPGTVAELGSGCLSWVVKWPHSPGLSPGIKSSCVFNDLQLSWRKFLAFNSIPPFEQHPEDGVSQVAAVLVDGNQVLISSEDVQKITLLETGI